MPRSLVRLIVVIAFSAGCTAGHSDSTAVEPESPPVLRERSAPPPEYARPLPATAADVREWAQGRRPDLPRFAHVQDRLEIGDPAMLARLTTTGRALSPNARRAWAAEWNRVFARLGWGFEVNARFCAAADAHAGDAASPLVELMSGSGVRWACTERIKSWRTWNTKPVTAEWARKTTARLRAIGFTDLEDPDAREVLSDGAPMQSLMVAGGRAWYTDAATGYPAQHDRLMQEVSYIARPALDDVIFEEHLKHATVEGECEISAYADGYRFRTATEWCGTWYDIESALRLMNAVLAQRRAPGRILLLRTDDQTARFAYGSAPAFAAAFAEKLLEPGDADSAMTLGKAFRREYVESVGRR